MSDNNGIRIVLGSLRYKSAPDVDSYVNVPFVQNSKEIIEFDRSIDINLEQVFDDERQKSDIFRPSCKFSLIFKNSYSGFTNYVPFENNLYYLNADVAANLQCLTNATNISWTGLPQYNEFTFIRTDYNVPGYTQPPNEHIIFEPKSASTYNWNFFISYPFENDYEIAMRTDSNFIWKVKNGIPYTIIEKNDIVSFKCPVKHGLKMGEFVKLTDNQGTPKLYNNNNLYQVYSLGDGTQNSDMFIFNLYNIGFTGTSFNIQQTGCFKRVILEDNEEDTISEYYVRKHKILTDVNDYVLVNAGFEKNIFGKVKKYESSGFTPNQTARVSIKEDSQSYTLSFNSDVYINPLRDNQKRPLSELFITVMWKGYFGWTFGVPKPNTNTYYTIKKGWDFNLPPINNNPQPWWSLGYSPSDTDIEVKSYQTQQGNPPIYNGQSLNFAYLESLKNGDILDGDFCEWNNFEQNERVISNCYHKITFNRNVFTVSSQQNEFGYYYQPHHSIKIREYSDYIETGDPKEVVDIPDYSYFSTTLNQFIWRDLYPYGFIDGNNRGITFPFMNGAHYPFENIIFRIIPEGTNYSEGGIVADPIIDECE
jgi:hypothetical protein